MRKKDLELRFRNDPNVKIWSGMELVIHVKRESSKKRASPRRRHFTADDPVKPSIAREHSPFTSQILLEASTVIQ